MALVFGHLTARLTPSQTDMSVRDESADKLNETSATVTLFVQLLYSPHKSDHSKNCSFYIFQIIISIFKNSIYISVTTKLFCNNSFVCLLKRV